eukprot:gene16968-20186_t
MLITALLEKQRVDKAKEIVGYSLPVALVRQIFRYAWRFERYDLANFKDGLMKKQPLYLSLVSRDMFKFVSSQLFTDISLERVKMQKAATQRVYQSYASQYSPLKRIETLLLGNSFSVNFLLLYLKPDNCLALFANVRRLDLAVVSDLGQLVQMLPALDTLSIHFASVNTDYRVLGCRSLVSLHIDSLKPEETSGYLQYLMDQTTLVHIGLVTHGISVDQLSSVLTAKTSITSLGIMPQEVNVKTHDNIQRLWIHELTERIMHQMPYTADIVSLSQSHRNLRYLCVPVSMLPAIQANITSLAANMTSLHTLRINSGNQTSGQLQNITQPILASASTIQSLRTVIIDYLPKEFERLTRNKTHSEVEKCTTFGYTVSRIHIHCHHSHVDLQFYKVFFSK